MTPQILIITVLVLTHASCDSKRTQDNAKQKTPAALEDKSSSYEMVSKRGYDDMVESLYNELVSKNLNLKELEDKIGELNKSKADTTNLFDNYNAKNQTYAASANRHISEIKDTLLRDKMKVLIANNFAKYSSLVARHTELLKIIEAKSLTISDLHNILKITMTLPLIYKYQSDNLPGTKSFEGYIKQQDETIKIVDTLIKK